MLGAIIGDIAGSPFEHAPIKIEDFQLLSIQSCFTDDSVMTVAVADAILHQKSYQDAMLYWGRKYPNAGYGGNFQRWLQSKNPQPYSSWGNGSAMRVSPVGFAFNTLEEVLAEAKKSAEISHNHPEGIKGAQAVAAAIWMAKHEKSKVEIRDYLEVTFNYALHESFTEIRKQYSFDVSAQGSVPQVSSSVEDAIRKAVSLGGDSDTQACMAGVIAQAFYKHIPDELSEKALQIVPQDMKEIIRKFNEKYTHLT